jgi:hypothetical protein
MGKELKFSALSFKEQVKKVTSNWWRVAGGGPPSRFAATAGKGKANFGLFAAFDALMLAAADFHSGWPPSLRIPR